MKRLLAIIGVLLVLPTAAGASKPLYERIKEEVKSEQKINDQARIVAYLEKIFGEEWKLTKEDIAKILQGNFPEVCGNADAQEEKKKITGCQELQDHIRRLAKDEFRIQQLGKVLQTTATSYELPISDLPGRALKLSADLRGILTIWSAGTGSVKSTIEAPVIRYQNVDEETFRPLLTDVGEALEELSEEEGTAAIWRYQYGVRLVKEERAPRFPAPTQDNQSGPGTERQYMFKRWENVEKVLTAIWDEVKDDTFTPPLSSTESVYYSIPQSLSDGYLPDNVIVWVRMDGDPNHIYGDVGLQWDVATTPVLPSLVSEDGERAILGGDYPPEPSRLEGEDLIDVDGMGLCTSPGALRGYLCRPFVVLPPGERCPVNSGQEPNEFQLVHCTNPADGPVTTIWCCEKNANRCSQTQTSTECVKKGGSPSADAQGCVANGCPAPVINPVYCCMKNSDKQCIQTFNSTECVSRGGSPSENESGCVANGCKAPAETNTRNTEAGPDVCREITWQSPKPFDPNKNCKVFAGLRCANNCAPGVDASAVTENKRADGVIPICISNNENASTYLLLHELVHAYQKCQKPVGFDPYAGMNPEQKAAACCKVEGEAYQAQCAMMERDGVFKDANGQQKMFAGTSIPINAETCAEIYTNFACGAQQNMRGCYTSRTYPQNAFNDLLSAVSNNPQSVPASCSDAIDTQKMDKRITDFIEAIERRDDICAPGYVSTYQNRIGNNACYIGQCVEQSVELHRIMGARATAGVGDEMAAWDEPTAATPLGNILLNPPTNQARIPAYRPQLLMREMEGALCQLQGLPPRTPPVLCAIAASRQLGAERLFGLEAVQGVIKQTGEDTLSSDDLLSLSAAVGTRMGTTMYGNYLRESNRSFADILSMANQLLKEIDKISFPTQMCPVGPKLPTTKPTDE